jgi:hypothetical protein
VRGLELVSTIRPLFFGERGAPIMVRRHPAENPPSFSGGATSRRGAPFFMKIENSLEVVRSWPAAVRTHCLRRRVAKRSGRMILPTKVAVIPLAPHFDSPSAWCTVPANEEHG